MIEPEAIVDPGFQMSFAATAALVALAESWTRPAREINTPWFIRMVQVVTTGLVASLVVSAVAGLATGPFAIQHFNRISTYGLLANMVTEPLTGFVIMPGLALGAVLAPLGLGAPILVASGWGISALSALSAWFAALPAAMITIPSAPALALPVAFVGLLWICLWKGRLRWLGVPAALAVSLWPRPSMPDVWIAADGANGAYRQGAQAVLAAFDQRVTPVAAAPRAPYVCKDADDQKFIDLAVAHQATLISKDAAVLCMARRLARVGVRVCRQWTPRPETAPA